MIAEATDNKTLSVIPCQIGDETYALDMTCVEGIQRSDGLSRIPGLDGAVGTLPSRSRSLSVFSLANQLKRSLTDREGLQQIVILKAAGGRWGLLVDSVSHVVRTERENLSPLPPLAINPTENLFHGVLTMNHRLVLLLDPERLHPTAPPAWPDPESCLLYNRRFASLPTQAKSVREQLIGFSLGTPSDERRRLTFSLRLGQVLEIVEVPTLIPVPAAPPEVQGLVLWRDLPIAVVDLAGRLDLPALHPSVGNRLIIVRPSPESSPIGFLALPNIRILRLPIPHRESAQTTSYDPSLVRGCFELKNETLVMLDLTQSFAVN